MKKMKSQAYYENVIEQSYKQLDDLDREENELRIRLTRIQELRHWKVQDIEDAREKLGEIENVKEK